MLNIPSPVVKSTYTAGKDGDNLDTQWTFFTNLNSINDVTVVYETYGGSPIEGQILGIGECAKQPNNPTREGYVFSGWYTNSELTEIFSFSQPITTDTIVYAKWLEDNKDYRYTVNFESNGGSTVPSQSVLKNEKATEPPTPTREGYVFSGWYANSELTEIFSFSQPITTDTIVYAKWLEDSKDYRYTVNFESNGGSAVPSQSVLKNEKATEPPIPTREGYRFKGWYSDKDLVLLYDFKTLITEDRTLYADWEGIDPTTNKAVIDSKTSISNNSDRSQLPNTGETSNFWGNIFGFLLVNFIGIITIKRNNSSKQES